MNDFNGLVNPRSVEKVKSAHRSLGNVSENLIHEWIGLLAKETHEVLYLDDLEVLSIDRNETRSHLAEKEVVSGDAVAWFAIEERGGGERIEKVDIQYGVYVGTQNKGEFKYDQEYLKDGRIVIDSQRGGTFVYEPIEVIVEPK